MACVFKGTKFTYISTFSSLPLPLPSQVFRQNHRAFADHPDDIRPTETKSCQPSQIQGLRMKKVYNLAIPISPLTAIVGRLTNKWSPDQQVVASPTSGRLTNNNIWQNP
jgi:hypothetical protein